jgi:predicted transposase YdaD
LAEYEELAPRDESDSQKTAFMQGLLEGNLEVAQNALREKLPVETVVKLTGLSLDDVKRLSANLTT